MNAHSGRSAVVTERSVAIVDPTTDPRWADLVRRANGGLFHVPSWLGAVARGFDLVPSALVLLEGDVAVAGIPFVAIDDAVGRRVVAGAFSDYCDPVGAAVHAPRLISELAALHPDAIVQIKLLETPHPGPDSGYQVVKTARWHGVRIDAPVEQVLARVKANCRYSARHALQLGMTVRRMKREEIPLFFRLHTEVRARRYRLLTQPIELFEEVYGAFVDEGRGVLLGAFAGDRIAAAHWYLTQGDTVVYKYGASDYELKRYRANVLLNLHALEEAAQEGAKLFDLGLSDDDQPGLIDYKRHLGAYEGEIRFLRHTPAGVVLDGALRATLTRMTEMATDPAMPTELAARLGRSLYRYFA
ncbi:MAG: GNAT family N-acetyltransferase [Acidobacteriota bacterium]